jgi:single-stranded DNA-binding protein
MSNNQLNLIGHTGKDQPEVKVFTSGHKVTKFSMAVKDFSNKDPEAKPLWIDVEAWDKVGDRVVAAVTPGREIAATGRLAIAEYNTTDKDGISMKVMKPILKLSSFYLAGPAPKSKKKSDT